MTIFPGAMGGGMGKTWEKPSFSPVNGVVTACWDDFNSK